MKPLSYRSRLRLKRIALTALGLLLAVVAVAVGFVIYLSRYLVFTGEEAYLSFLHPAEQTQPVDEGTAETFSPVQVGEAIARPDPVGDEDPVAEPAPDAVRGVWLSYTDLQDPEACLDAVHGTENCNTVLLSLKSNAGNYYYASRYAETYGSGIDPEAVNGLIATLQAEGYYLIARIAAFPDTAFALSNLTCGLQLSSGALWMDGDGYYWLDASDETVQQHLCDLAAELAALGIHEVALTDFTFPESVNIAYGELTEVARDAALSAAAGKLIDLGAEEGFAVSFCDPADDCPAPSADGHVLLTDYEGAAAAGAEETYAALIHGPASLIFLTDSRDTRFEPYGILRSAELEEAS